MKELNRFVLENRLFTSVKGHLFLTKGHSDNPDGQVEVIPLLIGLFLKSLIETKNMFFFKKGTFNNASDPRTLYLFKIGPAMYITT